MSSILLIASACALVLISIVVTVFIMRIILRTSFDAERSRLEERVSALSLSLEKSESTVLQREKEIQSVREERNALDRKSAELETRLHGERSAFAESREKLTVEFENLANRILEEKSKKFTDQNREHLQHLLDPLKTQIGDFRKKVEDAYDKESRDRRDLFNEIGNLKQLNARIAEDAVNLTNALKGDSKVMGNWGEQALERILELSGLEKGREYDVQVSARDRDGKRYQPDVIVRLPELKDIVVDSKVSLVAYERYYSAENDTERTAALAAHIASVRNHIRDLSGKHYESLEGLRTLDYVLMFIPVEAAFLTAIKEDSDIYKEAFDKNIILVCPSTLLVTLRTIANIWRYEYQNRNAQDIARKAAALYEKFVLFLESMEKTRDAISKASENCDKAISQLSTGRGNIVRQIEGFRKLGVEPKKKISENLLDTSDELPDTISVEPD